jgi:hypothetical protein
MDLHDEFRRKASWYDGEIDPNKCKEITKRVAIEFAEWCVITQAFGVYGYDHAFEIFCKEKGY